MLVLFAQPARAMAPQAHISPVDASLSIERAITLAAAKHGLDAKILTRTIKCESSMNPKAVGDHGTSFGIAQIHLIDHPEITKEQALDPYFSIEYMAQQFAKGNARLWSCYKKAEALDA